MSLYPKKEDFLIYEGRSFSAEWFYTEDGKMPAYDYYKELNDLDQRVMDKLVKYFCDRPFGEMPPKTWYRIEDPENKIYAFKPRNERFFDFTTDGQKVIITNAYRKHSQKMKKQDLKKLKISTEYRKDYLRRTKGDTYYE